MYKVVIVDDEPVIRAGLRELLPWEELGMQIVFEAENGAAALDYLHTHRVEILITDIRMEVMDGLELIRQAKALYPQLHCVILTGFDDFAYTKAAIRLGIENYILKPVDEKELLETLSGIENKLMQEEKGETVLDREKQVILQSVLTRWLSGSIEESALRHRANFLDLPLNDAYVQACVLRLLDIRSIAERQAVGMEIIRTWQTAENVRMRVCWENVPYVLKHIRHVMNRNQLCKVLSPKSSKT
ncbi:MAG: response regulator, partial [Oscillospiraceae bacterium]|nr:response regulator [Oscillospiraceae bacterium]